MATAYLFLLQSSWY